MDIPALAFFGVELSAKLSSQTIENPQTIGEHLRKRRLELKILQKEVAAILGVSEDTITYWENERNKPQIQFYPQIIQFLGYYPFDVDTKSIGGQIYKYRADYGLSHKNLARVTGFDPGTLSSWEQNVTVPSVRDRMKLVVMDIVK